MRRLTILCCLIGFHCFSQEIKPHINAHAHNDYEHKRPLFDALENGFTSVEADIHLRNGKLVVDHTFATDQSPLLEKLYLRPLDSLLTRNNGSIFSTAVESKNVFYFMLDIKTNAASTWQVLERVLKAYPALCRASGPVRIFLSGNRPIQTILKDGNTCIGIDGRPDDLGKDYTSLFMPVISDNFRNWSYWNGKSAPADNDLAQIRELAQRVHSEGKKLRLWSIPDHSIAWESLLNSGVDYINTDRLEELNVFLSRKGL